MAWSGLPMVRAVRPSRRSTEIESVAMKVPCHDPRAAYCSAAGTTSPEFTACKARPSLAHPATKGKALSFAKTVSAADLAASWWTHGSPGSHAAACFRRDEIGGEFSPEIVAQVKLIALLEAD